MDLNDIISGTESMPWWGTVIRVSILYISLIIGTRIMRERQVGILSGHNYLVAAGIVSLAAVRMVNPKSSLYEVVAIIFSYALVNAFLSYLDIKFPRQVDRIAIPLMVNGKLIRKNLDATHITIDNLLAQLRLKSITNLSEIQEIYLEPTGKVNALTKPAAAPPIKSQLNIPVTPPRFPEVVIYDGNVQEQSLARSGLTLQWLENEIAAAHPGTSTDSIFLAIVETNGTLYISTGQETQP